MRPVRVAMVCGAGDPTLDGVADYTRRLEVALREVDVHVSRVSVAPGRAEGWLGAVRGAARSVRRLAPDLVHVQFAPSAFRFSGRPGLLLPPLLPRSVPLVTTLHEYGSWAAPSWLPDRVWRRLERAARVDRESGRLVPGSELVLVTNDAHAAVVTERTGRRPLRVPVPANVDDHGAATGARRRFRRRLGLPADTVLLVFFGFVHPVKGVRYLLEALPRLRARHPALHLAVVGGFTSRALPEPQADAFRAELAGIAAAHGVGDAVTFTGYLPAPEVSEALHAADGAVLPFCEGVTTKSGALVAALAHGLPTAVTTAPAGDPDLVDGVTVAVIDRRRDAAAVARATDRLLSDPALRGRLARAGRLVATRRSWPGIAAAHRAAYERLLGVGDD
ncbi:glycosyltransferase family 4 protein [Polymorphospora sp. NPDC051019]|uniref:glycosyltransferase family 4 protein n=1 Tax=Polymorphospora sp. NPDC051019 TaxID=3155725 RepID=UPI003433D962